MRLTVWLSFTLCLILLGSIGQQVNGRTSSSSSSSPTIHSSHSSRTYHPHVAVADDYDQDFAELETQQVPVVTLANGGVASVGAGVTAASHAIEANPGFIHELRFDPAARERRNQPRRVVSAAPSANEIGVKTFKETFTFHASQTSMGYTIETMTDKTIEQLAKICYLDSRCTGFTSTGELKSFIRPASQWVFLDTSASSSINTDLATTGLYYFPQWYRFQPVPCPCGSEVPLNYICSDPNSGDQYLGEALTDSSCMRPKPVAMNYKCPAETCVKLGWIAAEFDACPTCGVNITLPRDVKCVSAQGTTFPDKFCSYVSEKPSGSKTCNAEVACQWNKVEGECQAPCGRGFKNINVTCISPVDQQVINDKFCTSIKPKTTRKCKVKDCIWNTVTDGKCSFSCGPGHRQLKITCIEPGKPDVVLPDVQCGGVRRPSVLVKCNNGPCNWETKPTSPCSQPCGKGQQTVSNTCKDPITGDVMPAKQCGTDPPPSFQYCSIRSCEWDTTPFGSCSNTCGKGVQYFNVTCRDPQTGHRVEDAQCSLVRPPAPEAPCENNACKWRVRPIGDCSEACGPGIQKLNVTCEDPITGKLIDEKECGLASKPNATTTCHVRECHWHRQSSGQCSSPCGQGIQAYKLSCRNPENGKKVKNSQCKNVAVPSLSEPCFLHACQWEAQNDGKCDQICGPGHQKRTISCHDPKTRKRVEPELCTDKAPKTLTKCYAQACIWSTVPTSQCSASCGTGTQTVNVTCTDPKKRFVLPESQCFDASRPNTTQPCNMAACRWKTTPASQCSNTCGVGSQKLNVLCADPNTQLEQDATQCDADTRPVGNTTCFVKPCAWVSDPPVSKCSQICGPGHVEVNVTCQDAQAGIVYPDELCKPEPKPSGLKPCQIAECKWQQKWSECGATCGGDFQYSNLTCVHEDGTVVSNTQCKAAPPAWRQCATEACSDIREAFLHYSFDDDLAFSGAKVLNRVSQASLYGLDGVLQGAGAKSTAGRGAKGSGIALPASNDHTSGPHLIIPPGRSLTSPSFSLSFWMKLLAQPTLGRFYIIVDNRGTNGGGEGFVIYLDPRDGLLYLNDAYSAQLGKSHFADSGTPFPNDNQYHHVTVTYNQKLVRFYLDGKQTSVVDPSHLFKFTVSIAQHKVYLRGSPDKYWRYLPMALDEFAYFDYPLAASQISILSDPTHKNVCEAGRHLTAAGCSRYSSRGSPLNARCATAPYSLTECLQPLWGLNGCSTLGTSYPTSAADAALWSTKSWKEVKSTVASFLARDVEPQLQAKKAWGTCQNRTPSGLDAICDHPPPYHTAICLQALFLEVGCSRRATGFPASASHPLARQLNELTWRDAKLKIQAIIKGDVKGGPSEGMCHDQLAEGDTL